MNRRPLSKRFGAPLLAICVMLGMILGGCSDQQADGDVSGSSVTELTEARVSGDDGSKEVNSKSGEESGAESSAEASTEPGEEESRETPAWEDESTIVLSEDAAYLFHAIEGWYFTLDQPGLPVVGFDVDAYGRFSGYSDANRNTYNFTGIFGQVVKTSEFTYEVTVADMICERKGGGQQSGISSSVYGIAKEDKLEIYLPGARIEGLPKGFQDGISDDQFGTYVLHTYYVEVPLELPFCGVYNPQENVGFCAKNVSGKNLIYFTNKGNFPGLKNKSLTIDEAQGTYSCCDEQKDGLYGVFNLCFRPEKKYDQYADAEEFVQLCVSQVTENVDFDEVYFLEARDGMTKPNLMYLNGNETIYVGWYAESGNSERDYYARVMLRGEYAYVYGYWSTDEDEFTRGVAGSFFLSSLTFTGNPKKISSEDLDHAVRKTYGIVVRNGADPTSIMVDEIQWMAEKNESGVGTHWVLSGDDGDYKAMQLSEACSIYLLDPEEGPLWTWQSKSAFHEKLNKQGQFYLMVLYLDENDQVTFLYEQDRS